MAEVMMSEYELLAQSYMAQALMTFFGAVCMLVVVAGKSNPLKVKIRPAKAKTLPLAQVLFEFFTSACGQVDV